MNDGGPAFPVVAQSAVDIFNKGMSLRDYFAAKALPAIIERYEKIAEAELASEGEELPEKTSAGWDDPFHWESAAVGAYACADAMLKARSAVPPPP